MRSRMKLGDKDDFQMIPTLSLQEQGKNIDWICMYYVRSVMTVA